MKPASCPLTNITKRVFTTAVILMAFLSLSGCITNKVLQLRQARESRIKAATNIWSLAAVRPGYIVTGGDAFACVEFRDSPGDVAQIYTINLSRTSLIGRTFLQKIPPASDRTETEIASAAPHSPIWYFYPLLEAQKGCHRPTGDGPSQISELKVESVQIRREDQPHLSEILLSQDTVSAGESRLIAISFDLEDHPSESSATGEALLVYLPPDSNAELAGPVGIAGAFEPVGEWVNPYTLLVAPAVAADTFVLWVVCAAGGDPFKYIDGR